MNTKERKGRIDTEKTKFKYQRKNTKLKNHTQRKLMQN